MQSTCTGEGYTVHTCSVCGDSYQDNTTPALGHSYTDTVTAPTCTETGCTTHTCSACGYSYQSDETAALGHSYTATVVAPTCTQQGYTLHECSACGDSYQDTYVDALGHSYTTTVVAPTCTERGYTLHECSACGDSYKDTYVAALGHNYLLVKDSLLGEVYRCTRCWQIKGDEEIPIIPVDPPVEVASYSLSGESERILDSTVVQEYTYVYNGSSLMQMVVQTTVDDGAPTTDTLYFSYDASGIPMSLIYNGADYYYTVNLQGDVTAILNTSGTAVVEYTYDAWGNILTVTGSMADTLGAVNPLTYRGYVYDTETGLYYLLSRYYNPKTGRFLNADAFTTTGQGLLGNNMFAYCLNNPINRIDVDGSSGIWTYLMAEHEMGYFHRMVQAHIVEHFGGNELLLTEVTMGAVGRADLVNSKTKALWEIKHAGVDPAYREIEAFAQALCYVIFSPDGYHLGEMGAFQGEFVILCVGHSYMVTYSTPLPGAILYRVYEIPDYDGEYFREYVPVAQRKKKKQNAYCWKPEPVYGMGMMNGNPVLLGYAMVGTCFVGCFVGSSGGGRNLTLWSAYAY